MDLDESVQFQACSLLAALDSAAQAFEQAMSGKSQSKGQKALLRIQKLAVPQFLASSPAVLAEEDSALTVLALHQVSPSAIDYANSFVTYLSSRQGCNQELRCKTVSATCWN